MPIVWIPSMLSRFADGKDRVDASGATVGEVVADLDRRFPGIQSKLVDNGILKGGLAVVVDSRMSRRGLDEPVSAASEIHFVAALAGG